MDCSSTPSLKIQYQKSRDIAFKEIYVIHFAASFEQQLSARGFASMTAFDASL
jgi:hypothetical protein